MMRLTDEQEAAAADEFYRALKEQLSEFFEKHGHTDQTQRLAVQMLLGTAGAVLWRVPKENQPAACQFASEYLTDYIADVLQTDEEIRADIARTKRAKFRLLPKEDGTNE